MLYLRNIKGYDFLLIDSETCTARGIDCNELYKMCEAGVEIPNLEGIDFNAKFAPKHCKADAEIYPSFSKRQTGDGSLVVTCVNMGGKLDLSVTLKDLIITRSKGNYNIWFKNTYARILIHRLECVYKDKDSLIMGLPSGEVSFEDKYFRSLCSHYERNVSHSAFLRKILF